MCTAGSLIPFLQELIVTVFTVSGLYFGIRGDLKRHSEQIAKLQTDTTNAHERIDDHINDHAKGAFRHVRS